MDCDGLGHLPDTQGRVDTRCFRYLNKDVVHKKSGKSRRRDFQAVAARGQAWNVERSRAGAYDLSFFMAGGHVRHDNGCPRNCAAFLVRYRARDRSRCSSLGAETSRRKKRH